MRGFDSGKKINGRQRHLLCDTQGLALELVVTPANIAKPQHCGAATLRSRKGRVWFIAKSVGGAVSPRNCVAEHPLGEVDAGYKAGATAWCPQKHGVELEAVGKDKEQSGFVLQQRRWVIERTFSWLSAHRRLARDYEGCLAHSESLVWIALSRILLRRLA